MYRAIKYTGYLDQSLENTLEKENQSIKGRLDFLIITTSSLVDPNRIIRRMKAGYGSILQSRTCLAETS